MNDILRVSSDELQAGPLPAVPPLQDAPLQDAPLQDAPLQKVPFHTMPLQALPIDAFPAFEVGEGCTRRDLPGNPGVRVWVVDMAPGAQWPYYDHHDTGESFYVVSGEVIEGEERYGAGTYVLFAPDSRHRPRTETGVRLFGFNVSTAAFLAAGGNPDSITHSFHPTQG